MALPANRERMLEEIAERHAERFRQWEDDVWEKGLAVFGKAQPMKRLQWYMSQTRNGDMQLALDTDYRERRKELLERIATELDVPKEEAEQRYIAGEFTEVIPWDTRPFQVEALFQQFQEQAALTEQAKVEAERLKVQMPQVEQPVPPPMMWVQLMGMSGRFMRKVQSDFRDLLNQQAKREGLTEPQQPQIPMQAGY